VRGDSPDWLEVDGNLVDFRSQNEIVLRQSAHGMSPQLDGHVAISGQMKVRVMPFAFGYAANALKKHEPRGKILDPPLFANVYSSRFLGIVM
jgi:hypothetical protein